MGLLSNRRRYWKPYDYEVEYLENTGRTYLDFGFILEKNIYDVFAGFTLLRYLSSSIFSLWFGCANTADLYRIGVFRYQSYDDKACAYIADYRSANSAVFNIDIGSKYDISLYKEGQVIVNEKKFNVLGMNDTTGGINSFTVFYHPVNNIYTLGRIHYVRVEKDGLILHDLIPVVKDGVGYMYDKISGKLFGAQGGGQFIVGPKTK